MFQRAKFHSMLLLGIVALIWGFFFVYIRPSDFAAMKKILSDADKSSSQNIFTATQQQRKGVVKEIWFTQEDNSRLNYRIYSESSLLTVKPNGNNFDLVEKLEKIKCWMQDKLYDPAGNAGPMQQVRFLAADEGIYRYASQEFLAQSVELSLFRMGGHELPKEITGYRPFLKGLAEDVSFAVSGKNPQFKAKHFKAELNHYEEKK